VAAAAAVVVVAGAAASAFGSSAGLAVQHAGAAANRQWRGFCGFRGRIKRRALAAPRSSSMMRLRAALASIA